MFVWEEGGCDCSLNEILWKSQMQQCLLKDDLRKCHTEVNIVKTAVQMNKLAVFLYKYLISYAVEEKYLKRHQMCLCIMSTALQFPPQKP